jgi:hypothetical protein
MLHLHKLEQLCLYLLALHLALLVCLQGCTVVDSVKNKHKHKPIIVERQCTTVSAVISHDDLQTTMNTIVYVVYHEVLWCLPAQLL